ncbi:MAG: pentapeptide repeat-containing protein [Bauldia sp.]|nr:pentapeptide repeat-containing protein [Bauldia sp.]
MPTLRRTALAAAMTVLSVAGAFAQAPLPGMRSDRPPTVWDLPLGAHARELPADPFIDFACGTNGGPPSTPLTGWTDFARCRAEPATGFHEVYFRYDDEPEYWARARYLIEQIAFYQYTTVFDIPVIVSLLFDADGFLVGHRIVSDPRVPEGMRENGSSLAGILRARYGEELFDCVDQPKLPGESEFQGIFVKRECHATDAEAHLAMVVLERNLRKIGQHQQDVLAGPTAGLFESTTYFQALLDAPIEDRAARLANLPEPGESERDRLIARALNCPGCDLRGVNLKRADLTGANLSGANLHAANLSGADLTGAVLVNANINRANLRQARLAGALLAGSMLFASKFDGADLHGANLNGVLAGEVQLSGANLAGSFILRSDLRAARITNADLTGAALGGSLIDGAQLTRSNLSSADLTAASLWRTNMAGANLAGSNLSDADLYGANLREADLSGANFSNARMTAVVMTSTVTTGATFAGAQLPAGFTPPP